MLLLGAPIDAPTTKQTVPSLDAVFLSDTGILELEQPPQSQCPGRTSRGTRALVHYCILALCCCILVLVHDYTEGCTVD